MEKWRGSRGSPAPRVGGRVPGCVPDCGKVRSPPGGPRAGAAQLSLQHWETSRQQMGFSRDWFLERVRAEPAVAPPDGKMAWKPWKPCPLACRSPRAGAGPLACGKNTPTAAVTEDKPARRFRSALAAGKQRRYAPRPHGQQPSILVSAGRRWFLWRCLAPLGQGALRGRKRRCLPAARALCFGRAPVWLPCLAGNGRILFTYRKSRAGAREMAGCGVSASLPIAPLPCPAGLRRTLPAPA